MINTNFHNLVNHFKNDLQLESEALVWLHSGVIGMGVVKGGVETITNAFEKVLSNGAVVIPTFTYSWCNGDTFDSKEVEGIYRKSYTLMKSSLFNVAREL